MSDDKEELFEDEGEDLPTCDRLSRTVDTTTTLANFSEVYPNQAAAQFELDDRWQAGNYNPGRQKGTSGGSCGRCCVGLVILVIVALLLALIGFSVYLWFEISSLKSGPDTCSMQAVGISQLNASTDSLFQMLQEELSAIHEQHSNLSSELVGAILQTRVEHSEALDRLNASFNRRLNDQLSQSLDSLNASFNHRLNDQLSQSKMLATSLRDHQNQSQTIAESLSDQSLTLMNINTSFNQQLQNQSQMFVNSLSMQQNQSQNAAESLRNQLVSLNVSFTQQFNELQSQSQMFANSLNSQQSQSQVEAEMLGSQLDALQNQLQMPSESLRGQYSSFPLESCAALPPGSPSSYYWVSTSTNSSVNVYCDMTRSCGGVVGGWTRIAYLDMTDGNQQCPSGLRLRTDAGLRTCGVAVAPGSCAQSFLHSNGLSFSRVCGRIIAYQVGSCDTFGNTGRGTNLNIDQNYVDGVSLTYGSPRQHIWSFAAGLDEAPSFPQFNCPCTDINTASRTPRPPAFVGNDYFCDTGVSGRFQNGVFYGGNPLWDGAGCGPRNSCCSFNSPPWFYKQLSGTTTSDIEMRVCRDQHVDDEDTPIEIIEIYVQ